MVYWQPGTQYNLGDVVTFEGADYRIIQPHRSQGDWTPPVTPALWGRVQQASGSYGGYGNSDCTPAPYQAPQQQPYQAPYQAPQPPQPAPEPYHPPPPQYNNNDDKHTQNQGQAPPQPQPQPAAGSSEEEHHFGIGKILGIGGGIAAGAALLGVGAAVYKHHEHKKDEEEWLQVAQRRTEKFRAEGPAGPATWVLTSGKQIPQGAIEVGKEHSWTLYIGRAFHKGSITPGKASDAFQKGAVIGYAHDEIHKDTYEVLVGDIRGLRWVPASGKLKLATLGARPVDGGVDTDGTPLFVARGSHKGAFHPGKISENLKAAFIPYDGTEVEVPNYEVLCYAQ